MPLAPATNDTLLDSSGDPPPPPPILSDDVLRRLNPGGVQGAPTPNAIPAINGVGRPPTGIAAGLAAPAVVGGNLRNQLKRQWMAAGATPEAAEGILRRIGIESNFDPSAIGDAGTSLGLYQHHADRAARLVQFASQQGKSPRDPTVQTAFAIQELKGGDPVSAAHAREILSEKDPARAQALFTQYFERPAAGGVGALGVPNASSAPGGDASGSNIESLRRAGQTVQQGLYRSAANEAARANDAIKKIGAFGPEIDKSLAEVRRARERSDEAMTKATESLTKQPQPPDIEGISKMGGLATIVGILGGMLTKQPMIASLNAASAAIGAYNDGDREKYDLAFKNWKTQNDLLFKIADMQASRAKDIMSDEKMGLEERRTALDLYLRASGQQALADKLRVKGDKAGFDYVSAVESAIEKHREFDVRIAETHEKNLATLAKDPAAAAYAQWMQEYVTKNKHYPPQEEASAVWKQAQKDFPKETAPGRSAGRIKQVSVTDQNGKVVVQPFLGEIMPDGSVRKAGTGEVIQMQPGWTVNESPAARGAQAATQVQSLVGATQEMVPALRNLVEMPINARLGPFMGVPGQTPDSLSEGIARTLATTVTSDEATAIQQMFAGINRSLATIEAQGARQGLVGLQKMSEVLIPKTGWKGEAVLRSYAEMRQIIEQNAKTMIASPYVADSQKELLRQAVKDVQEAVPWTVQDINRVAFSKNKSQSVKEFANKILKREGGATTTSPAQALPVPAEHQSDPDGTRYNGSDGQKYIKRGTQMVPE